MHLTISIVDLQIVAFSVVLKFCCLLKIFYSLFD